MGTRQPKRCPPTPACTSMSARRAEQFFGRSLETAASSVRMGRADAHPDRTRGHDHADGVRSIFPTSMNLSLVRFVATLLLSGQMLPIGLPLLCDQVQRATPANCDQQMTSHPSGPVANATTHAAPCANSAFCATTATAAVALGGAVSVSAGESHTVGFGVATLVPADPQPPLPPPPQA